MEALTGFEAFCKSKNYLAHCITVIRSRCNAKECIFIVIHKVLTLLRDKTRRTGRMLFLREIACSQQSRKDINLVVCGSTMSLYQLYRLQEQLDLYWSWNMPIQKLQRNYTINQEYFSSKPYVYVTQRN